MKIYDKTIDVLEKAMDLHMKRHAVLSSNVANSETPHYRARDVDFAGELTRALGEDTSSLSKDNPRHLDTSDSDESHIVFDNSGATGADGNNVDLDMSMGRLAENARGYSNAVNLIGVQLRLIKNAARGRSA